MVHNSAVLKEESWTASVYAVPTALTVSVGARDRFTCKLVILIPIRRVAIGFFQARYFVLLLGMTTRSSSGYKNRQTGDDILFPLGWIFCFPPISVLNSQPICPLPPIGKTSSVADSVKNIDGLCFRRPCPTLLTAVHFCTPPPPAARSRDPPHPHYETAVETLVVMCACG